MDGQCPNPLPTHGFEWITQPIDFMEIPDESDIGYILEVDMDYPQNLHNLHNDYPLAPETLNVTNDMLSPYCKEIAQEHNLNTNSCTKLVPNLMRYGEIYKYLYLQMEFPTIQHPSSMLISGPSNSEKLTLSKKLLDYEMFKPTPSKIIWCYGAYQTLFDEISNVEFIDGFTLRS
ncbi:uncharacterized protein TNCV_1052421 [Trichonephila clavipes]|nr:uncharacterized protein TNCV_1052421 [Trichonephila clavipes]